MLFKLIDYMKVQDSLRYPHRGVVVSNTDPKGLRRLKCSVGTLFEGSDPNLLPWVYPQSGPDLGNGTLLSGFAVPEVGSELVITFPYRDIYFPVYVGFWETGNVVKTIWSADYPESYGFVDSQPFLVRVNKTQQTAELYHPSEGLAQMDQSGNFVLNVPGNFTLNCKGNFEVHADGNVVEEASGNLFRQGAQIADNSEGKVSLKAGADLILEGGGKASLKGSSVVEEASGSCSRKGSSIVDDASGSHAVKAGSSASTTAPQIGHNSGGGGSAGSAGAPLAKQDISGDVQAVLDKAAALKSELTPTEEGS